jgi:hypothetical protein
MPTLLYHPQIKKHKHSNSTQAVLPCSCKQHSRCCSDEDVCASSSGHALTTMYHTCTVCSADHGLGSCTLQQLLVLLCAS